jgi:hypothetical protein
MKQVVLPLLAFQLFQLRCPAPAIAQRLANRYAIEFLRGPGTYTLADGTTGQGDLQFKTRGESVLYIDRKRQVPSSEVQSFTVAGHTLRPDGTFPFSFGLHSYEAKNAFIEYADTTGGMQLAVYYTAEPTGNMTTYYTTFLLRPRETKEFIVGPGNNRKWRRAEREKIATYFAQWPAIQQAIIDGSATFENFPEYVRRTH